MNPHCCMLNELSLDKTVSYIEIPQLVHRIIHNTLKPHMKSFRSCSTKEVSVGFNLHMCTDNAQIKYDLTMSRKWKITINYLDICTELDIKLN